MDLSVAVTGAAGFLGQHVVGALLESGVDVTAVVRPGGSTTVHGSRAIVEIDVSSPPTTLFESLRRPDVLMHLAWGHLSDYRAMDHFEHELPSHYGFVRAAVSAGVSSVVVTGTCLEYGLVSGEVDEDRQPRPTTPYGFAKDALRRELEFLRESTPFNLTWARLFYLYGPGQRTTSLIPRLEAAARAGDRSFPLSAGEHIRDYSRVEDVARDLADLAIQRLDAGIVNVCSGRGVRVLDFARQYAAEQRLTIDVTSSVDAAQSYESRAFWGDRRKLDNLLSHRAGAR